MIMLGHANHPRLDIIAEIEWTARNGFDFLDLFMEPDRNTPERMDPDAVRNALTAHNLIAAVGHIGPFLAIGSPLAEWRRASVELAHRYLQTFAALEVSPVTVHGDWPSRLFSDGEGIRWQVETLRQIGMRADDLGVKLMYEPIGSFRDTFGNLDRILGGVPGLMMLLDIGHANLHGGDPAESIRHFARRICHIHLHDNDGTSDQHRPPGAGTVDWPKVVRALHDMDYDATITIEVFSEDREEILSARRKVTGWLQT